MEKIDKQLLKYLISYKSILSRDSASGNLKMTGGADHEKLR